MTGGRTDSIEVAPEELGTRLSALRLRAAEAEARMQRSLSKLGQLAPVQAWRAAPGAGLELFDGAKRVRAAQALSWPAVRVEVHVLDAAGAKLGLLSCNSGGGLSDLEVAWVVRALYREDKLDQPAIAQMLGHDKSWVSRKLTLAEGLSDEVTAQVRLGVLAATAAVEVGRLQRCNQEAVAKVVVRQGLTTRQTARLVETLLAEPEARWPALLEGATRPTAPAIPKGGAPRRTPGEQLVADAWAMKRIGVRLHARLLERSLASLGEPARSVVQGELTELRAALGALTRTLDERLGPGPGPRGGVDARA